MTTQQEPQHLDGWGTIGADAAAMRLREATRLFLRALEDYHGLPRSFQTWRERNPDDARIAHRGRADDRERKK